MNSNDSSQKILVAIDFSQSSAAALKQAAWLARRVGSQITLAHVAPLPTQPTQPPPSEIETHFEHGPEPLHSVEDTSSKTISAHCEPLQIRAQLQRLCEQIGCSSLVDTRLLVGVAYREIIKLVEHERYNLVLLGTRGLSPWQQFLVGSTAKRLIRKCPSSVWVVKPEHVGQPKVVMAATDFSEISRKAAMEGLAVARQADAEFHLLHVVDSNDVQEDLICRIPKGSSLQEEINLEASKRMKLFMDSLAVGETIIQVHQTWGAPWQEIRRAAKFEAVDLLVIGVTCRRGLQGLMLGNTAEKVLDTCDCSILTVKADRRALHAQV